MCNVHGHIGQPLELRFLRHGMLENNDENSYRLSARTQWRHAQKLIIIYRLDSVPLAQHPIRTSYVHKENENKQTNKRTKENRFNWIFQFSKTQWTNAFSFFWILSFTRVFKMQQSSRKAQIVSERLQTIMDVLWMIGFSYVLKALESVYMDKQAVSG